eukprot:COSAG02_NODE_1888_length_10500_cov_3.026536_5_plen_94_part_00
MQACTSLVDNASSGVGLVRAPRHLGSGNTDVYTGAKQTPGVYHNETSQNHPLVVSFSDNLRAARPRSPPRLETCVGLPLPVLLSLQQSLEHSV